MFKLSKADTGVSRICKDIAGYTLGASIFMAGVYVVAGSVSAYVDHHIETTASVVVADSGYARHVAKVRKGCQESIESIALNIGPDIEQVDPRIWQAAYWQCMHNNGAML